MSNCKRVRPVKTAAGIREYSRIDTETLPEKIGVEPAVEITENPAQ